MRGPFKKYSETNVTLNRTNLSRCQILKCARMACLDNYLLIVMVNELMAKVRAFDKQF